MNNIKDTMSNVAAWLIGIGGLLATVNATALHLPVWVTALGAALAGLGGVITSIYTGKNPNGTSKTPDQVNELNSKS